MKNRVYSAALAASLLMINSGCSSKEETLTAPSKECSIEGVTAPKWACGIYRKDGYYISVGTAALGKLGQNFERREALANARTNLAQQIQGTLKDRMKLFMHSNGLGDGSSAEKISAQVSKQVARETVGDAAQLEYWQAPSKEIYLLVGVPVGTVNNAVQNALYSSCRGYKGLCGQFRKEDTAKALEKEFPVH